MPLVHHLALRVRDPGLSAAFYEEVLGLDPLRHLEDADGIRAVWLRAGGVVLMLERQLRGRGAESGSAHVLVFATADLGDAEARLAAAGIPVDDRSASTLYLRDPDGHRVGLSTYRLFPASP